MELSPVFAPGVAVYSASVAHEVSSTTVTATAGDPRASVTLPDDDDAATNGVQVDLEVGATEIEVTVTAEDGTTDVYTVTVTRPEEGNPPVLSGATVDGDTLVLVYSEDLDEESKPGTDDFTAFVTDAATDLFSINKIISYSIDGSEVTLTLSAAVRAADLLQLFYTPHGDPLQDLVGNDAAFLIWHRVTNITDARADATLSTLTLSGVELSPEFASAVTRYTATVAHGVSSTTVTATTTDTRASVTVPRDDDAGTDGVQVDLDVGSHGIRVTVTAEDGTTTRFYDVVVTRAPPPETDVKSVDWQEFDRGTPSHHNARKAKGWLSTTLKWGLNGWWNNFKNFDAQDGSVYLNFAEASNTSTTPEHRIREPSAWALALAVALKTGAYDAAITGVSREIALNRTRKLIRSLAYWYSVNIPDSEDRDDGWGPHWQSRMWAAHTGMAGWMLWDDLSALDQFFVRKMVVAEANEYRNPLYYRNGWGQIDWPGDSKTEEQAWNVYVLSLAVSMLPLHPNVSAWKSSSIHLMLSTYSRPADVSSSVRYHGHRLSEWLEGSNIYNDGTVINHGFMHPDYMAAGLAEFNPALIYFLAGQPIPKAARFNVDRVMEAFVELDFMEGSKGYAPEINNRVKDPGGTIFRPGTLCQPPASVTSVANFCYTYANTIPQSYAAGHTRFCLPGPPSTDTNVFYPHGSDWSKKRRPNLAMFVAQADVFGLDYRIDDATMRADYWFACFVRDVRAMQARHADGRTWRDSDGLGYPGREGQSAHYAAKAWLAYWIGHQNDSAFFSIEDNTYPLEFNRIATIEAEDAIRRGNAKKLSNDYASLSGFLGVQLLATGTHNGLRFTIDAPSAGRYNFHIVYMNASANASTDSSDATNRPTRRRAIFRITSVCCSFRIGGPMESGSS